MEEETTYEVDVRCSNCCWKGQLTIQKGKTVRVIHFTECPMCGNEELEQVRN